MDEMRPWPRSRGWSRIGETGSMPLARERPAPGAGGVPEKAPRPLREVGPALVLHQPEGRRAGREILEQMVRRRPADVSLLRGTWRSRGADRDGVSRSASEYRPPSRRARSRTSSARSTSVMCCWRPIRPTWPRCLTGAIVTAAYLGWCATSRGSLGSRRMRGEAPVAAARRLFPPLAPGSPPRSPVPWRAPRRSRLRPPARSACAEAAGCGRTS